MRVLICRIAAFGDTLVTTPLLRYLKSQCHEIYYLASEQAQELLQHNPNVDKIIPHIKDSVPCDSLDDYFKAVAKAHECDKIIDLCESIEVRLALHPSDPRYKMTKNEKLKSINRNYYMEAFEIAHMGFPADGKLTPEFFASDQEDNDIRKFISQFNDRFVVIWGLSGSARQKVYPYVYESITALNAVYSDLTFITVGDESCQILEQSLKHIENVVPMSGVLKMRESVLACKYASLVISPDTGLLHGSGCWDTPKIGLFTATTIINVSNYFKNDYSIEAQGIGCSPCLSLIYSAENQCTLGDNKMPICMAKGIPVANIATKFAEVYQKHPKTKVIEPAYV